MEGWSEQQTGVGPGPCSGDIRYSGSPGGCFQILVPGGEEAPEWRRGFCGLGSQGTWGALLEPTEPGFVEVVFT